jgi:hypothetical protein
LLGVLGIAKDRQRTKGKAKRGIKSMSKMYFRFDDDSKHIIIIYDSLGEFFSLLLKGVEIIK